MISSDSSLLPIIVAEDRTVIFSIKFSVTVLKNKLIKIDGRVFNIYI
jgi:hypothetical protein